LQKGALHRSDEFLSIWRNAIEIAQETSRKLLNHKRPQKVEAKKKIKTQVFTIQKFRPCSNSLVNPNGKYGKY
jgi:hypothetical protein